MGGNDNCCVADCRSRRHNSNISFHRIPKKPEFRRKLLIKATGRVLHGRNKFAPTNNSLFCGRHFVNGKRSDDPASVDFIPTMNLPVTLPVTLRQRRATVSSMKSSKYERAVETLVKEDCSVCYTKKRVLLPEIDLRNEQNEVQISHERSDEMTECEMLHCQIPCEGLRMEEIEVQKCGVKFDPPAIVITYKEGNTGKLRRRTMPLRDFTKNTKIHHAVDELCKNPRHIRFVSHISKGQLDRLVTIIKDKISGMSLTASLAKNDAMDKIDPEQNLNTLDDDSLRRKKSLMDATFEKNRIKPGDANYQYDVEVEFDQENVIESGWDSDEEGSDLEF